MVDQHKHRVGYGLQRFGGQQRIGIGPLGNYPQCGQKGVMEGVVGLAEQMVDQPTCAACVELTTEHRDDLSPVWIEPQMLIHNVKPVSCGRASQVAGDEILSDRAVQEQVAWAASARRVAGRDKNPCLDRHLPEDVVSTPVTFGESRACVTNRGAQLVSRHEVGPSGGQSSELESHGRQDLQQGINFFSKQFWTVRALLSAVHPSQKPPQDPLV